MTLTSTQHIKSTVRTKQFLSTIQQCLKPLAGALATIACLQLQGCSYFKSAETTPHVVALPDQWSASTSLSDDPVKPWLEDLGDPVLAELIEEAFDSNPNLRGLNAATEVAEQQTWLAWSVFWPQIDAGLRASRNKRNNAGGFAVSAKPVNTFGFSLDFIWEIDLWYKLGNELEATEHEKTASLADYRAAKLSLAANIAKTWFDGIVAIQQVNLAEKTIDSFKNALEIIEQGYDRGLYQALDVRLARTNLLSAQGRKENFLSIRDATTRTLEALLGRYPSASLAFPDQLPATDQTLPDSVPSTLLERRPDIIAAAQRFFAADQRMLKARKNLLPTIQISGSGGTSSREYKDMFNPEFIIWNIAGNLTQPIFHGGQLFAERFQAEARVKQAAAQYAQVVLQAFQEVETTMAAEQWLRKQQELLNLETKESREAERLAENSYVTGLTNITTLLEAQRRAFDSENNLLEIRKQRLQNRVNLYLALGGPVLKLQ
ncbi:MAG: efflux transporter outer membrane subunit [Gammaproteobacteria bacterium]|nr:efflux transporter outer membrane subunit [Gammaproteobacteria bacterium]